ncbi:MAG TPA: hypothetical protein VFK45_03375 [Gammaproteobacteria bacterium]|nr:hypothetical protein [Gammaproteobacteria bacterium]
MRAAFLALITLLVPAVARAAPCPAPPADHPQARWHNQYRWEALAAWHYRIGDIRIHVAPIYDLTDPDEDAWYARTVDTLHVPTRDGTIREQLLFRPGEPVNASRVYQTERRLRGLGFLQSVAIAPASCHGNVVDVDVDVKDAWTLKPEISFTRIGGDNIVQFEIEEENLLGYGKSISIGHLHGTQRDQNYVNYFDPALAGSRWQLFASLASLSDGFSRGISLERPFFANTTRWSAGASFLSQQTDVNFYDHGERAWSAIDRTRQLSLSWRHLVAWDGVSGWRIGARYIDESFRYGALTAIEPTLRPQPGLPDREFRGLQATVSFFQDRYATFHNLRLVGRAEDYNLGWTASAAFGYFPTAWGSSTDAWIGGVSATYGRRLPADSVLFFGGGFGGRYTRGAWRGSHAGISTTWYNQHFGSHTLVAHLDADWRLRADPEDQLYLGGLAGLRGYPNYFRAGDRRWQFTFEDRILTSSFVLETFQVGYVFFVDAGQMDRLGGRGWSPVFSDIGGGLRFGNTRFSFANVIYVTVAVPLVRRSEAGGYQILIGDVINF